MPLRVAAVVTGIVVALVLPAVASAGTVSSSGGTITFAFDPAATTGESLSLGVTGGTAFVDSDRPLTAGANCSLNGARVECPVAGGFVVNLGGFNDSVNTDQLTGPMTIVAHGGSGADGIAGSVNGDQLFGDDGDDNLYGRDGNDILDGGGGGDLIDDGPGNDTAGGGPGNDTFVAGPGADLMSGGDGADRADYSARLNPVTITLNGVADDGEAGEGDNVAADVEDAVGGAGNDRIVGGVSGGYLYGNGGNDTITGSPLEDRIEAGEGDDVVDARDGGFDSIDCGPGNDVVYADPGDSTTGCEVAPDRDGDGYPNDQDCAPDDPAVHPGAGEVFGNNVDEDCSGGPGYLIVDSGVNYNAKRYASSNRARFTVLTVSSLRAGDRVELRCLGGKKKACPFTKKTVTATSSKKLNLVKFLKKRKLRRGAVVEVRILRANEIGRVVRHTVGKRGVIKITKACQLVGSTKVSTCPIPA
jgi:Ca2+-binding RTX toxin-like protein